MRSKTSTHPPVEDATALVLRRLSRARRRTRQGRGSDTAYMLYVLAFVAVLTLPPTVSLVLDTVNGRQPLPEWSDRFLHLTPALLTAGVLILLWMSLQDALVRGPLAVGRPMIDWVLSLPIDRARALRPVLLRALAAHSSAGAALGGLSAVFLLNTATHLSPEAASVTAILPALGVGALVGLLTVNSGVLVMQGHSVATWLARAFPLCYLGLLVLLLAGAGLWHGIPLSESVTVLLWSGPWGWAAQGVLAAIGYPVPYWGVAVALMAALVAATGGAAHSALDRISLPALRERSDVAFGARSGLWLEDPSWFQVAVRERRVPGLSRRFRLPPPHRPWMLVAWRDLLGLVRSPALLARAALMVWLAFAVGSAGIEYTSRASALVIVAVIGLLYGAGSQLAQGARIDATDPRRMSYLPYPPGTLAILHGGVPMAALLLIASPAVALATLGTGSPDTALHILLVIPACLAAALSAVYRGLLPLSIRFGVETPFGNSAPMQILLWHGSGQICAAVVAAPTLAGFITTPLSLGWTLAGCALLLWWTNRRAQLM